MNHLENNKLIAEFMGFEFKHVKGQVFDVEEFELSPEKAIIYEGLLKYESELQYHTSWKWLMPVVEEIHTHGCEIVISSNGVTTIYAPSGEVLAEESSEEDDHMHDATYKAIVKVLKENLHKPCQ